VINQSGTGALILSANNGNYTGNITVSAGTLALTNSGSVSNAASVTVGTGSGTPVFNISRVASGSTTVGTLTLNNAALTLATSIQAATPLITSAALIMSGTANTINVPALPAMAAFPTAITLVQAQGGISVYNGVLGTLPATFTGVLTNNTSINAIQ